MFYRMLRSTKICGYSRGKLRTFRHFVKILWFIRLKFVVARVDAFSGGEHRKIAMLRQAPTHFASSL